MRGGRGDPSPLGEIFLSNSTEPTVVVQKAYDWALWIIPKVEKFPKSYRFSIGQSLVTASIELLLDLVDATYQARLSLCRVCGARPGRCLGQWAGTGFIHGDSGSANSASASVGPDAGMSCLFRASNSK